MKGLDSWITGNYGEDHPDNQTDCEPDRFVVIVRNSDTGKCEAETRIRCQSCGLNFREFTVTCPRCDWYEGKEI